MAFLCWCAVKQLINQYVINSEVCRWWYRCVDYMLFYRRIITHVHNIFPWYVAMCKGVNSFLLEVLGCGLWYTISLVLISIPGSALYALSSSSLLSFRISKLVPASAGVNESTPQIWPSHGMTMYELQIDVRLTLTGSMGWGLWWWMRWRISEQVSVVIIVRMLRTRISG